MDCHSIAANLACDHQSQLAIAEVRRNAVLSSYMLLDPGAACELADRVVEHDLQKTPGALKKMCITPEPIGKPGPWGQQFDTPLIQERFMVLSKAKSSAPLPK